MIIISQRLHFLQRHTRQGAAFMSTRRRLDVAIVGAPNAGKSQLLNQLLGKGLAAVSRKQHTTRTSLMGVRTIAETQLTFWDTPGYQTHSHDSEGDRELRTAALRDMETVDYSLLVVDSARALITDSNKPHHLQYYETIISLMLNALQAGGREEIVLEEEDEEVEPQPILPNFGIVLNKVDLVSPKSELLIMVDHLGAIAQNCIEHYLEESKETVKLDDETRTLILEQMYPQFFFTDSLKAEGTDDLLKYLQEKSTPCKVWAVEDVEEISDLTLMERIEEIIREKIYRTLHRELPHSIHQVHRNMAETPDGVVTIDQDLVVKSKSHYRIVRGRNLKTIQLSAQHDLQKNLFSGKQVILRLHVKHSKSQHDRSLESAVHGGTRAMFLE